MCRTLPTPLRLAASECNVKTLEIKAFFISSSLYTMMRGTPKPMIYTYIGIDKGLIVSSLETGTSKVIRKLEGKFIHVWFNTWRNCKTCRGN